MGHSGGGGGHSNINRPARGLGRVPAAGHGGVRPLGTGGRAGVRHPDRGIRGGVCDWRLSARPERPAPRGALGHGPALRRVLCGGPPARGRGRVVLGTVQCPGGAGHGLFVPLHPVLRPEMVQGPQRAGHGRHWRGGGALRRVPDRLCPDGIAGLWPGTGHPGRVLGAGGRSPCPSASWAVRC